MQYGVYITPLSERIITRKIELIYYCAPDCSRFGARLYRCDNTARILSGVCDYDLHTKTVRYAAAGMNNKPFGNDDELTAELFTKSDRCEADDSHILTEKLTEQSPDYIPPAVSQVGIGSCLKSWAKGVRFEQYEDALEVIVTTSLRDYIFILRRNKDDIYIGISINIPCDKGLFGGNQYFRIRTCGDCSMPYCNSFANYNLRNADIRIDEDKFTASSCNVVMQNGIYMGVKSHTDDMIVLQGCGDDEYVYVRNTALAERFQ